MSLNGVKASAVAEMKVNGAGTFLPERQPGCLMDWKRYGNGRSLRRKVSIRLIPLCPSGASLRPAWRAVVCRADVFYRRKTDQNGGTESWPVWRKESWYRSVRRDC